MFLSEGCTLPGSVAAPESNTPLDFDLSILGEGFSLRTASLVVRNEFFLFEQI
jgi:hypothetical protein